MDNRDVPMLLGPSAVVTGTGLAVMEILAGQPQAILFVIMIEYGSGRNRTSGRQMVT